MLESDSGYGVDSSCRQEASVYARELYRIAPLHDDEHQLRGRMIATVLTGECLETVFPDRRLTKPTERYLDQTVRTEIRMARTVLQQRILLDRSPEAFLGTLTDNLSAEEQSLCRQGLLRMTTRFKRTTVDMALRSLNGEPLPLLAAEYGVRHDTVRDARRKLLGIWSNMNERFAPPAARLAPGFPTYKRSLLEGVPVLLPYLDEELGDCSMRMNDRDFAALVDTFIDSNMTSEEALIVLAKLHWPHLRHLARDHPVVAAGHNARRHLLARYMSRHQDFYERFDVRPVAPTPRTRPVYENSEEATKLILKVLAAPPQPTIPREVFIDTGKDIEAGVYAQELLRLSADTAEGVVLDEETKAELLELAVISREAVQRMLSSHIKFVRSKVFALKYALESPRDMDELMVAGMRGLLRAVRKYDYTSGYMLIYLAAPIVYQFVRRDIISNDWKVSIGTGDQITAMRMRSGTLTQQLRREPTPAELARELGITVPQLEQLQMIRRDIRGRLHAHDTDDTLRHEMRADAAKATGLLHPAKVFDKEVRQALTQQLRGHERAYMALEMRFAQQCPPSEIAEALDITIPDVERYIEAALGVLVDQMSADELRYMLRID